MSYATLPDLYARFGETEVNQVADTDGTSTPDPVLVSRALADATAEIEAALVGRYQLPLSPIPTLLTRIACDLAREGLYTDAPPDVVKDRAKTARALLASVASGKLRFEGAELATGGPQQSDARLVKARPRMRWPRG